MNEEHKSGPDLEAWFNEIENRLGQVGAKLEDVSLLATRSRRSGVRVGEQLSIVQELVAKIEDRVATLYAEAGGEIVPAPRDGADVEILFRDVPDFSGYRVGNDGSVWGSRRAGRGFGRTREWRRLKPYLVRPGPVPTVSLYRDRVRYPLRVAAVVLLAFVGPCPAGSEVRHVNGDPLDNRLDNLRYVPSRPTDDSAPV